MESTSTQGTESSSKPADDNGERTKPSSEDKDLEEQALDEILRDIKRGSEIAREHGALGWQKNPNPPTNKRFLRNMLVSTLRDDRPFKRREFKPHHRPNHHHHHHHHHQADDTSPKRPNDEDPPFRYNHPAKPKAENELDLDLAGADSFLAQQFREDWVDNESGPSGQHRSKHGDKKNKKKSKDDDPTLEQYDEWRNSLKRPRLYSSDDSEDSYRDKWNGDKSNGDKKDGEKKHRKSHRRSRSKEGEDSRHKRKHKKSKKSKKSKHKSKKSHRKEKH